MKKRIERICESACLSKATLERASKTALIEYALHLQFILDDIKNGLIEGVVIEE
tara:strand:- start:243 stop:404 length:162 start_codon:yes stop_codon:yes gene_type:complete